MPIIEHFFINFTYLCLYLRFTCIERHQYMCLVLKAFVLKNINHIFFHLPRFGLTTSFFTCLDIGFESIVIKKLHSHFILLAQILALSPSIAQDVQQRVALPHGHRALRALRIGGGLTVSCDQETARPGTWSWRRWDAGLSRET